MKTILLDLALSGALLLLSLYNTIKCIDGALECRDLANIIPMIALFLISLISLIIFISSSVAFNIGLYEIILMFT